MPMMLASFAGTCQTKVHLMRVMLGPADADDARGALAKREST